MLALVACVACFLAVCRASWDLPVPLAIVLTGPVLGGGVQLARGKLAIEGGVAGGVLSYAGIGIIAFVAGALGHLNLPLLLAFSALGGVVVGTIVGVALDFAAALVQSSISLAKALANDLRPEW
jgi:hypothetical protein